MDEQTNAMQENGLSAALENLFSDPAARERFEKIVAALKTDLPKSNATDAPLQNQTAPASPLPDGLSSILANPSMLENLPALLSGMRPQNLTEQNAKTPEDRRRDLLLALKPFLSKDRGNAVDLILQISRLGAVLQMMR